MQILESKKKKHVTLKPHSQNLVTELLALSPLTLYLHKSPTAVVPLTALKGHLLTSHLQGWYIIGAWAAGVRQDLLQTHLPPLYIDVNRAWCQDRVQSPLQLIPRCRNVQVPAWREVMGTLCQPV